MLSHSLLLQEHGTHTHGDLNVKMPGPIYRDDKCVITFHIYEASLMYAMIDQAIAWVAYILYTQNSEEGGKGPKKLLTSR